MEYHLVIVESEKDFPIGAVGGVVLGETRKTTYAALENYRNTEWWVSLMMCGMEFTRVSSHVELTVDQVMYMLSRMRGKEFSEPGASRICIWLDKYTKTAILGIGINTYTLKRGVDFDRGELLEWIDINLQMEFE